MTIIENKSRNEIVAYIDRCMNEGLLPTASYVVHYDGASFQVSISHCPFTILNTQHIYWKLYNSVYHECPYPKYSDTAIKVIDNLSHFISTHYGNVNVSFNPEQETDELLKYRKLYR